jgi:hypothetical protein
VLNNSAEPRVGQRARLVAPLVNSNSNWMPVETGMPVGLEGTIVYLKLNGPENMRQIRVRWDNGHTLSLLPSVDHYTVFDPKPEET